MRTTSKSLCLYYPRNTLKWLSFLSLTCAAAAFTELRRCLSEALRLFILKQGPMFGSWGPEACQQWCLHSLALGCAPKLPDVAEGKSERCSTSTEAFKKKIFSGGPVGNAHTVLGSPLATSLALPAPSPRCSTSTRFVWHNPTVFVQCP